MFYEQLVLAKKGPLGVVWMAAHMHKKLGRTQIQKTNISAVVTQIVDPHVPLALRLSAHLLLGTVHIYQVKVDLCYKDASDAFVRIKMVSRPLLVTYF